MKNVYRHFATDPSAWHLIHMPIAERLGPAPTPTPFCGSQKTARACLWSRANYSSLERGEKLYLCCQLLGKHKDFCRLKTREWVSEWVWGAGGNAHRSLLGWLHFWMQGKGKEKVPGTGTWRTQLHVSAWCLQLPFVPLHVPSCLKVVIALKIDPMHSWTNWELLDTQFFPAPSIFFTTWR